MFRAFIFAVALLANLILTACTADKQPYVTTMPLLPYGYEVSLRKDCTWVEADIPINDQGSERIKFNFPDCPVTKKVFGDVVIYSSEFLFRNSTYINTEYGVGIQAYGSSPTKNNTKLFFGMAKLGPLSKKRFIDMYLEMHEVLGDCEALKQDPYAYTIIRSNYRKYVGFDVIEDEPWNEFMARLNMYRHINGKRGHGKKCMQFPTLIFAKDIVFILPYNSYANGLDYQSIRYEVDG